MTVGPKAGFVKRLIGAGLDVYLLRNPVLKEPFVAPERRAVVYFVDF